MAFWFLYLTVFLLGICLSFTGLLLLLVLLGPHGQWLSRKIFSLGLTSVWRPIISVNDEGEIILKKRHYHDGRSISQAKIGGQTKDIQDPQDRLHNCYGTPLGLYDEIFGFLFDPRDCDGADRGLENYENGTLVYRGKDTTGERPRLIRLVRGFFELPKGDRAVSLSQVRALVGGWADAHTAERLIQHYRTSQEPRESTSPIKQFLLPVGVFIGVTLFMWILATQANTGGSAPDVRNISFGSLLLLGFGSLRSIPRRLKDSVIGFYTTSDGSTSGSSSGGGLPAFREVVVWLFAIGVLAGLYYVFYVFFPWSMVPWLWGVLTAGLVFLPVTAGFLGRSLGPIGAGLGKLYVILGLLPFDLPVLYLTADDEYEIREFDELDDLEESDVTWYGFARSWLGIAYENKPEAWPGMDTAIEPDSADWPLAISEQPAVTDGGSSVVELIPSNYRPASLSYGGHTGFIPEDPDDDTVYVQSHHVGSWYRQIGQNEKLLVTALDYAKKKFGHGTKPLSDKVILIITIGMAIFAALFSWMVFM